MSRIRVINEISVPRDSRVLGSFTKLPAHQQHRAREAFVVFKQNPFDSRLGAHKIQKLSARYGRDVYAAEIEANL